MSSCGYIKSWRQELDSDIWLMPPLYHRVWTYILKSVSWEDNICPTKYRFGIHINKGQGLFSIQQIADATSWKDRGRTITPNKKSILDVLKWLSWNDMIDLHSNANGTFISVRNWDKYQTVKSNKVTDSIPDSIPGSIPDSIPTKEVKEVKEGKEVKHKDSRGAKFDPHSIKPEWMQTDQLQAIITHRKNHKNKPVQTQAAYKAIFDEMKKAIGYGFTIDQCIADMSNKNWQGFMAEWMINSTNGTARKVSRKMSQRERDALELLGELK